MSQNKASARHYTTAFFRIMAVVLAGVVTGGLLAVAGGYALHRLLDARRRNSVCRDPTSAAGGTAAAGRDIVKGDWQLQEMKEYGELLHVRVAMTLLEIRGSYRLVTQTVTVESFQTN